ncbi:hypothetical protein FRC12_013819 [Ceratobasidium sp. 428]|nr:hypothetical protein FRC12_013819 [Ceratobasidium sp. 428]
MCASPLRWGLGMRAKGQAWDGSEVVGRGVKIEEGKDDDVKMDGTDRYVSKPSYMDVAPPGMTRLDVVITIVWLLHNFSIEPESCTYMAWEGSKVMDIVAGLVEFRLTPARIRWVR